MLQPVMEKQILDLLLSGRISFVWLGMPCTSFSTARYNDGIGPPPLRSDDHPMGLSGLRSHDRRELREGNQLLYFTCRIMSICEMLRVPYVLENPWSSRCWKTPILKKFIAGGRTQLIELHFRQFNERWKKPTELLCYNINLQALSRCCKGSFKACSATRKPHLPLNGFATGLCMRSLISQHLS